MPTAMRPHVRRARRDAAPHGVPAARMPKLWTVGGRFECFDRRPAVAAPGMMLKEHMGSSVNHFGPSSMTSTLPPRAARRPTVTTSRQFLRLHTFITFHHLLLFHF